jgi:hypothetical protein
MMGGGVAEMLVAGVVVLGLAACASPAAAGSRRWRSEEGWGVPRGEVTYDHRALVVNGTRRMLFSGEMHYPRSTPEVINACTSLLDPLLLVLCCRLFLHVVRGVNDQFGLVVLRKKKRCSFTW